MIPCGIAYLKPLCLQYHKLKSFFAKFKNRRRIAAR